MYDHAVRYAAKLLPMQCSDATSDATSDADKSCNRGAELQSQTVTIFFDPVQTENIAAQLIQGVTSGAAKESSLCDDSGSKAARVCST